MSAIEIVGAAIGLAGSLAGLGYVIKWVGPPPPRAGKLRR